MKLVSLNIALFENNNKEVIGFLEKENADFICLQEVTRRIDESVKENYISYNEINKISGYSASFFGPNSVLKRFELADFHGKKPFIFDFGGCLEFGNFTKSKLEIVKGQCMFVENCFTYFMDCANWPDEDYRSILITDHIVNNKKLRLINYHGIWTRDKQGNDKTMNANKIIRDIAHRSEGEVIICGDFNLFPDTESMKIFRDKFRSLVDIYDIRTTRPSANELNTAQRNVVDYVWISEGIIVTDFSVPKVKISDHLPLILNFNLF